MSRPETVRIIEVCPRDGFQNVGIWIPTDMKLQIVDEMVHSRVGTIEVTSFPYPRKIPALADGETVLRTVKDRYGDKLACIVAALSPEGAMRATRGGADMVSYVFSAGERHHRQLTDQAPDKSLQGFAEFCRVKGAVKARLSISAAFASPLDGVTEPAAVLRLMEAGLAAGADEVNLADTTGTANPRQTENLLTEVARVFAGVPVTLHFHDTQGMGLANAYSAYRLGFTSFEASAGGLGGDPRLPGAAGNIATEDAVNMFASMGVKTGVDLERLVAMARSLRERLNVSLSGHLVNT